ncbi:sterol desaturase family protein [Ruegeria faecimaris]|uniref:sterol desaturase family protein n=1 Tax=Ruegeria faecimaris TaxID=686389 RepID=UPI00248F6E8B|nr:sterol desaturase family protein [Ruegeria faecimaris]
MEQLSSVWDSFLNHARYVFTSPLDPTNRIFYVYVGSSLLIAFAIYAVKRRNASHVDGESSFLGFLFPRKVWNHPSAWLDIRYFFFHKLIGHFLILGLLAGSAALSYQWASGGLDPNNSPRAEPLVGWLGALATFTYMLILFLIMDFIGYAAHYLQHKVPLLWQFHKVHHSAEVMHPLSNFREHPIDNILYNVAIGFGAGAVTGFAFRLLGYQPNMPALLGVPVLMFLFNVGGYNLRHSHIWLRWPGVWSKVFPSPAHHHVHHSCHPDHLDKNFAFMFPFWDVLFGTYIMPEDNRDVKFGVTEKDKGHEMDTCMKLYFLPFRDAWRILNKKRRPTSYQAPDADAASRHSVK